MTINLISFFITSSSTMGGDTRIMIELAKQSILQKKDITLRIFISPEGEKLFRENGLTGKRVKYEVLPVTASDGVSLMGHMRLFLNSLNFLRSYSFKKDEIIYTRSHFWPELFVSIYLKKRFKTSWLATMFLFYPLPWKGFEHSYDNQLIIPSFGDVWKWIYSTISFWLIKNNADMVLITNSSDESYFSGTKIPPKHVLPVYGGLDLREAAKAATSKKKTYEGIFVGRLHQQKGIESLLRSWAIIHKQLPKAKLAIIGVGDERYVAGMKELVKKLKINKSIEWLGYVNGVEKYKVLKKSKVFLHSTVYDNNGMAAAEALAVGVPVVRFDLPPLAHVYSKGCLVAKRNNLVDFAENTLRLLEDERLYNRLHKEALIEAKKWEWRNKGKIFLKFLYNYR